MKHKLGAVIVTYNRLELLKECIFACLNQSYEFHKILIVDNFSTDGTREYLKTIKSKKIDIVYLDKNSGGAGGFNAGVEYYINNYNDDIDYLLFIDDDAILDVNYNKFINENITDDKNIIGYSGCVMTDDKIMFDHRRFLCKGFKEKNSAPKNYENEFFDYNLSTFCGLFLSFNIIKKIGSPKKEFFIWYDDTEYCIRAGKYGYIRNINKAFLNHKTKQTISSGYCWKSYYAIRNKYIIIKENYGKYCSFKYRVNCRFMCIAGYLMSFIKNDKYYKIVGKMYSDAINDAIAGNMYLNPKYTFELKINKRS